MHLNGTSSGSTVASPADEDRIEFPAAFPGYAAEATAAASPFPAKRPHWTALERVGFRVAFLYSPLLGAWHLDATHRASGAFLDPEAKPITDLYVDPSGSNFTRSGDGELWPSGVHLDAKKHTVTLRCYVGSPTTYAWQLPDANHMILTSIAPEAPKPDAKHTPDPRAKPAAPFVPAVLTLTRTPIPSHYPLLERGFHFVNQWGLER